jgi:hypothetical protein
MAPSTAGQASEAPTHHGATSSPDGRRSSQFAAKGSPSAQTARSVNPWMLRRGECCPRRTDSSRLPATPREPCPCPGRGATLAGRRRDGDGGVELALRVSKPWPARTSSPSNVKTMISPADIFRSTTTVFWPRRTESSSGSTNRFATRLWSPGKRSDFGQGILVSLRSGENLRLTHRRPFISDFPDVRVLPGPSSLRT